MAYGITVQGAVAAGGGAPAPVVTPSDTFLGIGSAQLIDAYSSSWSVVRAGLRGLTGGGALSANPGGAGNYQVATWNANAFAATQFAQCLLQGNAGVTYMGPLVRMGADGVGYGLLWSPGAANMFVERYPGLVGDPVVIASLSAAASGVTAKLTANALVLRLFINGVDVSGALAIDAPAGAQACGVNGYNDTGVQGNCRLNNWLAGDGAGP